MSSLSHVTGRKKSLMSFQLSVMLSLGLMLNIEDALVIAIIWRNNCNKMKNQNTAQCRNASKFQSNRRNNGQIHSPNAWPLTFLAWYRQLNKKVEGLRRARRLTGQPEPAYRRTTDNAMAKQCSTKHHTVISFITLTLFGLKLDSHEY